MNPKELEEACVRIAGGFMSKNTKEIVLMDLLECLQTSTTNSQFLQYLTSIIQRLQFSVRNLNEYLTQETSPYRCVVITLLYHELSELSCSSMTDPYDLLFEKLKSQDLADKVMLAIVKHLKNVSYLRAGSAYRRQDSVLENLECLLAQSPSDILLLLSIANYELTHIFEEENAKLSLTEYQRRYQ